jgi:hypothetical protein
MFPFGAAPHRQCLNHKEAIGKAQILGNTNRAAPAPWTAEAAN